MGRPQYRAQNVFGLIMCFPTPNFWGALIFAAKLLERPDSPDRGVLLLSCYDFWKSQGPRDLVSRLIINRDDWRLERLDVYLESLADPQGEN